MRKLILVAGAVSVMAPGVARATSYTIQEIYVPGSTDTYLTSINNLGQAVGFSVSGISGPESGVIVSGGAVSTFTVPGQESTRLQGINDKGQLVGQYYGQSSPIVGFVDTNGVIVPSLTDLPSVDITGINNAGDLTGSYGVSQGFISTAGVLNTFASYPQIIPYAINSSDVVSGTLTNGNSDSGFIYDGSGFQQITYPGAAGATEFGGVNDLGQVVGNAAIDNGFGKAATQVQFIYSAGTFSLITPLLRGQLTGINDSGVIIGNYEDATIKVPFGDSYIVGATVGFIATPVQTPEPSSLALMAAGLIGLMVAGRGVRPR